MIRPETRRRVAEARVDLEWALRDARAEAVEEIRERVAERTAPVRALFAPLDLSGHWTAPPRYTLHDVGLLFGATFRRIGAALDTVFKPYAQGIALLARREEMDAEERALGMPEGSAKATFERAVRLKAMSASPAPLRDIMDTLWTQEKRIFTEGFPLPVLTRQIPWLPPLPVEDDDG